MDQSVLFDLTSTVSIKQPNKCITFAFISMLAAASYFERDDASVWLMLHLSIVVDAVFGTRVILAVAYDAFLLTTFAAVSYFERAVQQRRRLAAASFVQMEDAFCCIFVKRRIGRSVVACCCILLQTARMIWHGPRLLLLPFLKDKVYFNICVSKNFLSVTILCSLFYLLACRISSFYYITITPLINLSVFFHSSNHILSLYK